MTTLDFALLRGVIEEIPLGVATTREGEILYANGVLERIWGAMPGGLDGMPIERLLGGDTTQKVRGILAKKRVFDGRIRARGIDGRDIHAELHVERYSASAGTGGFLLVRDASFEAGALGRLVDQLGGAMFRIDIGEEVSSPDFGSARLEYVSSAISALTGIEARACVDAPKLLYDLIAPVERERLRATYQRLARGDVETASAEFRIQRPDGVERLLQVHATGRRDASGVVRQVEGVVTGGRPLALSGNTAVPGSSPELLRVTQAQVAPPPIIDLSQEILREMGELLSGATSDASTLHSTFEAVRAELPEAGADLFGARLDALNMALAVTGTLCRRVRRAMTGRISRGALVDLLENVRTALAPLVGEHTVDLSTGDAGVVFLRGPLDVIGLALVALALRAFRAGGSGLLRLDARRRVSPSGSEIIIEVVGEHPVEHPTGPVDESSGLVPASPRPPEEDRSYEACVDLISASGGLIETDEWTLHRARTVIVLREDTRGQSGAL